MVIKKKNVKTIVLYELSCDNHIFKFVVGICLHNYYLFFYKYYKVVFNCVISLIKNIDWMTFFFFFTKTFGVSYNLYYISKSLTLKL